MLYVGILLCVIISLLINFSFKKLFDNVNSISFLIQYSSYLIACGFLFSRFKSRKNLVSASIVIILLRSLLILGLLFLFKNFNYLGNILSLLTFFIVLNAILNLKIVKNFSSEFFVYGLKRSFGDFILPLLLTLPIFMLKIEGSKDLAVHISLIFMVMNGVIALIAPLVDILFLDFLDTEHGAENIKRFGPLIFIIPFLCSLTFFIIPEFVLELFYISKDKTYYFVAVLTFFYSFVYLSVPFIDAKHDGQKFVKHGLIALVVELVLLEFFKFLGLENYYFVQLIVFVFLAISIFLVMKKINPELRN